jgi:hypothetical protein
MAIDNMKKPTILQLGVFSVLFIGQPLFIGLLLSRYEHHADVVGDFYAAIATILFLSNVLGFGADRFIVVQLNRLKTEYYNSLKSNYTYIIIFFLILFANIAVIALAADIIVFFIFKVGFLTINSRITHPAELCLFCIFFVMTSNFMSSFLRGIGRYDVVVKSSIITILIRISIFFLILSKKYVFDIHISYAYNIVFTLMLLSAAVELIRIIFYSIAIIRHLTTLTDLQPNKIDKRWRNDIFYYALFSLQYDLVLTFIMLIEAFGTAESSPATCGYIFVIVRVFQLLGTIFHQMIRDSFAKSIVYKESLQGFIKMVITLAIGITIVLLISVLYFIDHITLYLGVSSYKTEICILVSIGAIKSILDALFSVMIFTSRQAMKSYTYISTSIFAIYILSMVYFAQVSLNSALWAFIIFYATLTLVELLMGMYIFKQNLVNLNKQRIMDA